MSEYTHPHPDYKHVMRTYRTYLLWVKRRYGSCRGLAHYRGLLETYLAAKAKSVGAAEYNE
jgi:hypothetical protein